MSPSLHSHPLEGFYPLAPAAEGRFFSRAQGALTALVGVLDLPRTIPVETMVPARLNVNFWVDPRNRRQPTNGFGPFEDQGHDLNGVLTSVLFAQGALPDALEIFTRRSAIEHDDPDRQWLIFASITKHRFAVTPTDGLYELRPNQAPALLDPNPRNGWNIGQVLREPLWGPGGQYGLATSMELKAYERLVTVERPRTMALDPAFADFVHAMNKHPPLPLAYTRAEHEQREALAMQCLIQSLDDEDDVGNSPAP